MESVQKRRPKSSKSLSSDRSKSAKMDENSPYSQNYRPEIPHCQKHLIAMHLSVPKLSRPELEDRYLSLMDENYAVKHENKDLKERVRIMTAQVRRATSGVRKFKSEDVLSPEKTNQKSIKGVEGVERGFYYRMAANAGRKLYSAPESERLMEIQQELDARKEECEQLKGEKSELEEKIKDMDEKMFQETKKLVSMNMEMKSLKRKAEKLEIQVKHFKDERRTLEERMEEAVQSEKDKFSNVQTLLEKEREKNAKLSQRDDELESNRRNMEALNEQIVFLETEKQSLKLQIENLTTLIEKTATERANESKLCAEIKILKKELELERSERKVLEESQALLLDKLKKLQDENDSLLVDFEGIKSKLDVFSDENVSLELRLRDSEQHREELLKQLDKLTLSSSLSRLRVVHLEPWELGSVANRTKTTNQRTQTEGSLLDELIGTDDDRDLMAKVAKYGRRKSKSNQWHRYSLPSEILSERDVVERARDILLERLTSNGLKAAYRKSPKYKKSLK